MVSQVGGMAVKSHVPQVTPPIPFGTLQLAIITAPSLHMRPFGSHHTQVVVGSIPCVC